MLMGAVISGEVTAGHVAVSRGQFLAGCEGSPCFLAVSGGQLSAPRGALSSLPRRPSSFHYRAVFLLTWSGNELFCV